MSLFPKERNNKTIMGCLLNWVIARYPTLKRPYSPGKDKQNNNVLPPKHSSFLDVLHITILPTVKKKIKIQKKNQNSAEYILKILLTLLSNSWIGKHPI